MTKNKKLGLGIAASVAGLLIIGGGSFALVKHNHSHSTLSAQEIADNAASAAADDGDETTGSVPSAAALSQTSSASTPSSSSASTKSASTSLTANSSSAATSLGQLGGGSQSGASSAAGTPAQGTASSSASSNPFDPTTFAQYDKYDSETSPLSADVQTGTGAALASGQTAAVYYKGWLTNGTLFDQSRADSSGTLQPFSFTVGAGQVIKGWDQGLVGMKVGGVRLLIVPASVGYGNTAQASIPANSLLVFQIQLAAIK